MREIKFRAWNINTGHMWNLQRMNFKNGQLLYEGSNLPTSKDNIKSHIIMQYTGLKDNKGIEIYEGDIVKAINRNDDCREDRKECFRTFEVTELNGCFMFGNWNAHELFNRFMFREVVGNIYENPELLEGQKWN